LGKNTGLGQLKGGGSGLPGLKSTTLEEVAVGGVRDKRKL